MGQTVEMVARLKARNQLLERRIDELEKDLGLMGQYRDIVESAMCADCRAPVMECSCDATHLFFRHMKMRQAAPMPHSFASTTLRVPFLNAPPT